MRAFTTAYQAIAAHIRAKLAGQIAHMDLWYRQVDFPEQAQVVAYPAVFFEFAADFTNQGNREQVAGTTVSLYVATSSLNQTEIGETPGTIEDAMSALSLSEDIYSVIHAADIEGVPGTLIRTTMVPYAAQTMVLTYVTTYRIELVDEAAAVPTEEVDLTARQITVSKPAGPAPEPAPVEEWFTLPK